MKRWQILLLMAALSWASFQAGRAWQLAHETEWLKAVKERDTHNFQQLVGVLEAFKSMHEKSVRHDDEP